MLGKISICYLVGESEEEEEQEEEEEGQLHFRPPMPFLWQVVLRAM